MNNEYEYYVYILASKPYGTLYTGITNNLIKRIEEHKSGQGSLFVKKYNIHRLVYYEKHGDVSFAIDREKRIKRWKRQWKIELIEKQNPLWDDLRLF